LDLLESCSSPGQTRFMLTLPSRTRRLEFARVARVYGHGRRSDLSMLLTSRWLLIFGSHTEKPMLADKHLFESRHGIFHEMKPVGNLQRLGCSLTYAIRISTGTVATDHADARMVDKPLCQRVSTSIRQ
jgi:hypothetical protein